MEKLRGGADLMTPGLANGPPFPEGAVKGAVVAVASMDKHTVPLFLGVCEIDIFALGSVQGTKGHAVRGLHWEGDELWQWSLSSRPGQPAPDYLAGWDDEVGGVEEGMDGLTLEEKEKEGEVNGEDAHEFPADISNAQPLKDSAEDEKEPEPTTKGK